MQQVSKCGFFNSTRYGALLFFVSLGLTLRATSALGSDRDDSPKRTPISTSNPTQLTTPNKAQEPIYGPTVFKASFFGFDDQRETRIHIPVSTLQAPYTLVIQNGSGKIFALQDCSSLKKQAYLQCLINNQIIEYQRDLDRVESAKIEVNERQVIGPEQLNDNVATLSIPVVLKPGDNTIDLSLTGFPSSSVTVTVMATVPVGPLVPSFTLTPQSGVAPQIVAFNAMGTTDPGAIVTSYSWAFGDGTIGSGILTNHTYQAPGTYQVTLNVADIYGFKAKISQLVTGTLVTAVRLSRRISAIQTA